MKKVLGKLTGLSIVLAMVFNLFMPMMVSAANKIIFNPGGGAWWDGTTNNNEVTIADTSTGHPTEAEIRGLVKGKVTKDGYRFDKWTDGNGVNYKDLDAIVTAKDSINATGDVTFTANWVQLVNATIRYVDKDNTSTKIHDDVTVNNIDINAKVSDCEGVKTAVAEASFPGYEIDSVMDVTNTSPVQVPDLNGFTFSKNTILELRLKKKQYTVTTHSNTQPEVPDATSEITVEHGKKLSGYNVEPAVKKSGCSFLGWYTDSACKNIFDVNAPITEHKTIYAKWSQAYKIVEGANATIDIRDGMDLVVKADADLSKFKELHIDDKVVPESDYTKTSGSTRITLKAAYLTTLADGEHTIKFVYDDGAASTKFTIVKGDVTPDVTPDGTHDVTPDKKSDDKSPANVEPSSNGGSSNGGSLGGGSLGGRSYGSGPKTGDAGIAMWGILLSASLVGAAASIKRFRKVK